jgi:hypothetical protein|tara:strand:+ start:726 stop:893 length:168 start_codon:yes stop_codon:yes gene_type:complete
MIELLIIDGDTGQPVSSIFSFTPEARGVFEAITPLITSKDEQNLYKQLLKETING